MNDVRLRISLSFFAILLFTTPLISRDWRGIVPLKSNRNDVERLLGKPKQDLDWVHYYSLANEIVVFRFKTQPCDSGEGPFGFDWNVPIGTVVSIGVIPKGTHRRDHYQLTNEMKRRDNGAGFLLYFDVSSGIYVETYTDIVTLVQYTPTEKDEPLRCPRVQECCIDPFSKFDEYSSITSQDEKARLDNFFISLTNSFARGTIEVLGPSKEVRERRLKSANLARNYLVKKRGAEPNRLLVIDGGFSNVPLTRLSMYPIGDGSGFVILYPEKDP